MADFFKHDGVAQGLLLSLGSGAATALLLAAALLIAGLPLGDHLRWFAACFVPPILLLRHCAKRKEQPVAVKTMIVALFVSFVAFMFLLFRTNAIEL